jgi:molecular chaperone GrpE
MTENSGENPAAEAPEAGPEAEAPAPGAAASEVERLQTELEAARERHLRAAAELDNLRKRAAREQDNARQFAIERFAAELLGVVDSLEMGVDAGPEASAEALREGGEATLRLLQKTLEQFGVAVVAPEGEPFDPQLHEAIATQPSPTAEPGSVLTVVQKGYCLNGRLLRPARVIVAAEQPAGPADGGDG